ncbi:DUF3267 domain-containing protein [Marinicrinis lubricantis]|uniref:DUF3267 domain-containing protein n=1 Tax=Marinicrinis lubricantis TaxID=2086470 RepID=A0ABW1IVW2_9BACL
MPFIIGKVYENEHFTPELEGWTRMDDGNILKDQLKALPIALMTVVVMTLIYRAYEIEMGDSLLVLLALFIIIVPLHEFIHAFFLPDSLRSDKVFFGLYPKGMAFYVHYEGGLSKTRFLVVMIAPFVILSIVPMIILIVFDLHISYIARMSVLNGLLACVDLLGFSTIVRKIPRNATIRNKGSKTYWKVQEIRNFESGA